MHMVPPPIGSYGSVSKNEPSYSISRACIHSGFLCVNGDRKPAAPNSPTKAFIRAARLKNSRCDAKSLPSCLRPWTPISNPRARRSSIRSRSTRYRSGTKLKDERNPKNSSMSATLRAKDCPTPVSMSWVSTNAYLPPPAAGPEPPFPPPPPRPGVPARPPTATARSVEASCRRTAPRSRRVPVEQLADGPADQSGRMANDATQDSGGFAAAGRLGAGTGKCVHERDLGRAPSGLELPQAVVARIGPSEVVRMIAVDAAPLHRRPVDEEVGAQAPIPPV